MSDLNPASWRAVIIHSDPERVAWLGRCIENLGCAIGVLRTCSEGALWLKQADRSAGRLIVIEVNRQKDDRRAAYRFIRALAVDHPDTVTVAITGADGTIDAHLAIRAHADAYIVENMRPEEASKRIVAACLWKRTPTHQKELPEFLKSDFRTGISIVDRSFCVRYMNEHQQSISAKQARSPGICWMEYDRTSRQSSPCPWCPVQLVFEDGQPRTSTTVSPVEGKTHFYEVAATPIWAGEEIIAAVEVVRDITEQMVKDCQAAVLQGEDAFRKAMIEMLRRTCQLGLDRARLWIATGDPHYLEGFASYGSDQFSIVGKSIDLERDRYSRQTRHAQGVVCYPEDSNCNDIEIHEIHEMIHAKGYPWLELPLIVQTEYGERVFVGKLSFDNEISGRHLPPAGRIRELLLEYGSIIAPLVAKARAYWLREEQAKQARAIRQLDVRLATAMEIDDQMKAIVDTATLLLGSVHCHVRHRQNHTLILKASAKYVPWRLREKVNIDRDIGTSISASLVSRAPVEGYLIWREDELPRLVSNLEKAGRYDSASHFREMRSSGAFALYVKGDLIGTLVIDSQKAYFFDEETIAVIKNLVQRAEMLLESNLQRIRLSRLLDTLASEVAVIDRRGTVKMGNRAWNERMSHVVVSGSSRQSTYSETANCLEGRTADFDEMINSVFRTGKPARLVATFSSAKGVHTEPVQKDVVISPFDVGEDKGVENVLLVLSDMLDPIKLDRTDGMALVQSRNLRDHLRTSVDHIRQITHADRTVVVEFLGERNEEEHVLVWSVSDGRPIPAGPIEGDTAAVGGINYLKEKVLKEKYLAISDVTKGSALNANLQRAFQKKLEVRSFLAVPVSVQGLEWGALLVEYCSPHDFTGLDIQRLQDVASALSVVIQQYYLTDFQRIERQLDCEPDVPKALLDHLLRLMTCHGGHVRLVDWVRNDVTMRVASNPYQKPGQPTFRERVPLGEPVAGVVATCGEPYIAQDAGKDAYHQEILGKVPEGRDDLREYLKREQSYVCYPLILEDEIFGTFGLSAEQTRHFTKWRLNILKDFIDSISPVLRGVQNIERIQAMVRQTDALLQVSSLTDLWERIPQIAASLFRAERSECSSYDPHKGTLRHEGCFHALLGESELLGSRGHEAYPSDAPHCGFRCYVAYTQRILRAAGEEARSHPYRWAKADECYKREKFTSVLAAPLKTPDGLLLGVLKLENRRGRVMGEGFTEMDEALVSLFAMKIALILDRLQFMETKNQAIITRTHDFKTPLQAVRATLECLREGAYVLPKHADRVDMALSDAKRLDAFIVNTLDVAEGRVPPQRFHGEVLDIKEVLDEIQDVFVSFCRQDGWSIKPVIDSESTSVYGDRYMLFRILLNLVENARKYAIVHAQAGGGSPSPDRNRVEIRVHVEDQRCEMSVCDRGPGIDPTLREAILDRNRTSHGATGRALGIGLPAVIMLAKVHGGDVKISAGQGGVGTVVTVSWDQEKLMESCCVDDDHSRKDVERRF